MGVSESKKSKAEPAESELLEPRWSIVSFDRREAVGLTYAEAVKKMAELEGHDIPGLCIVTDETGSRLSKRHR
jgi:hypothetical protein